MKDKEKQIEEMAYMCCHIGYKPTSCSECIGRMVCYEYLNAKKYVEQGYRKIPQDDVVLTKEEYQKIVNEREEYLNDRFAVCHALRQSRKETAKEIWTVGKYYYSKHASKDVAMNMFADWIKEEYGVEED